MLNSTGLRRLCMHNFFVSSYAPKLTSSTTNNNDNDRTTTVQEGTSWNTVTAATNAQNWTVARDGCIPVGRHQAGYLNTTEGDVRTVPLGTSRQHRFPFPGAQPEPRKNVFDQRIVISTAERPSPDAVRASRAPCALCLCVGESIARGYAHANQFPPPPPPGQAESSGRGMQAAANR